MTIDLNRQTILKADEMPIWSIVSPANPVPGVFQTNKKSSGSELVKISHFQGPCLPPRRHGTLPGIFTAHERPCCHSNLHICLQWQVLSTGTFKYCNGFLMAIQVYIHICVSSHAPECSAEIWKTFCHFSFQKSIWSFPNVSLLAFQTSWSSQASLPMVPTQVPLKIHLSSWLTLQIFAKPELFVVQMFGLSHFSHLSHFTNLSPECISMRSNTAEFNLWQHCHCHWHCHCQWQFNCTGFQSLPLFIDIAKCVSTVFKRRRTDQV